MLGNKCCLFFCFGCFLENFIVVVSVKLFKNNDAQSLASAIEWALSLKEKDKNKFSKAAIKNVRDNFTKQIMCDKTIEVYNELMRID